jgi:hypothetical protein
MSPERLKRKIDKDMGFKVFLFSILKIYLLPLLGQKVFCIQYKKLKKYIILEGIWI